MYLLHKGGELDSGLEKMKNCVFYLMEKVPRLSGTQTPGKDINVCSLHSRSCHTFDPCFATPVPTWPCQHWELSSSFQRLGSGRRGLREESGRGCLTCWLSGPCFFQVIQRFVIVPKVVEGHTWPVKGLEVLSFLLQDFEAILLDSFIIYQLSLEQAGCGGREKCHQHNSSRLWVSLVLCSIQRRFSSVGASHWD